MVVGFRANKKLDWKRVEGRFFELLLVWFRLEFLEHQPLFGNDARARVADHERAAEIEPTGFRPLNEKSAWKCS